MQKPPAEAAASWPHSPAHVRSSATEVGFSLLLLACLWVLLPVPVHHETGSLTGNECLALGDHANPAEASTLPALERCSAMLPDDTELLTDLGAAYEASGETARAETAYVAALAIDARLADVHARLSRLLLRRGAAGDARRHAAAALEVQPNRRALVALLDEATRAEHTP